MFTKGDEPQAGQGEPKAPATATTTAPAPSSGAAGQADQSLISAGLKVVGNLESNGDVVIAGVVEGDIASRSLTVSQGATVQGSIQVETVQVMGAVQGQVRARSVRIARTGEMTGDVHYETLSIEEGAMIDGQCRRVQPGRPASESKVSKLTAVEGGGAKKEEAKPAGAGGATQH
jgi:cytoskeletal protein CcmA (bactofilin family)